VGITVGEVVGSDVVGDALGVPVGAVNTGEEVGAGVGPVVGEEEVGAAVGDADGAAVGVDDGPCDTGLPVGCAVGSPVGGEDGDRVGANVPSQQMDQPLRPVFPLLRHWKVSLAATRTLLGPVLPQKLRSPISTLSQVHWVPVPHRSTSKFPAADSVPSASTLMVQRSVLP